MLISRHSLREAASPEPPCSPEGATAQNKELHERLTENVQEDRTAENHGHSHSLPVSYGGSIKWREQWQPPLLR